VLHHISIPALDPLRVARVLARLMKGKVYPFPPVEGAYITVNFDEYGTAIEVYPIDTAIRFAPGHPDFRASGVIPAASAFHAALSVPLHQDEIEWIAGQEGWRVQLCDRGPFRVIELWLENHLLIELLSPELTEDYIQFLQPRKVEEFFRDLAPV
jgi:hypothetical protein